MDSALQISIVKTTADGARPGPDLVAVEEPLEIRLAYGDTVQKLAVTMRTPGHDAELAVGFLFTEGIIAGAGDVNAVEHLLQCSENRQNTILVSLKAGVKPNLQKAERNFYTTSSCGVCGKASIEAIRTVRTGEAAPEGATQIDPQLILGLPDHLAKEQEVFAETGGLHAAAFFDPDGVVQLVREDVGRHNALDKLIGAAMIGGRIPLNRGVLLLSGRASFELIQKGAMARIPVIAAVGAPSSLAISLAEEFGMTLIGFLRNNRFNIYSGAHRIKIPATPATVNATI